MNTASGAFGEQYTAAYLQKHGFTVLERNFSVRGGELDMIARNAQYLIFVEVKTRSQGALTAPAEAVTAAKRRRIARAALCYLQARPSDLQPRFDVACVEITQEKPMRVTSFSYFANAFFPEVGFF